MKYDAAVRGTLKAVALSAAMVLLSFIGVAGAFAQETAKALFSQKTSPSPHLPMPVGSYARGCAAGLVELPANGPSWQAMRLSRNRNWGHPETIRFLIELSQKAQKIGWNGLYIGDISQPRGGPVDGHQSHQLGLDADVWLLPPERLDLSEDEREKISSISVRSRDQKSITQHWSHQHFNLLKTAASDPRVDRIFIAAAVKIAMCRSATAKDRKWLQKIRPAAGHNTHFHVRLKCPEGASLCQEQRPSVSELSNGGDGCDETLMWWVTDYLEPPKKSDQIAPPKKPYETQMSDLPAQCQYILDAK